MLCVRFSVLLSSYFSWKSRKRKAALWIPLKWVRICFCVCHTHEKPRMSMRVERKNLNIPLWIWWWKKFSYKYLSCMEKSFLLPHRHYDRILWMTALISSTMVVKWKDWGSSLCNSSRRDFDEILDCNTDFIGFRRNISDQWKKLESR